MGQHKSTRVRRNSSSGKKRPTDNKDKKKEPRQRQPTNKNKSQNQNNQQEKEDEENENDSEIDLSITIPITLQQLLLNVFKYGLLPTGSPASTTSTTGDTAIHDKLDIKSLVQTIKSHLYNRDFDSAFTDADEQLLRAYALRWSATRALGYVGIFKGMLRAVPGLGDFLRGESSKSNLVSETGRIVCVGGGAGAEIVALAGVWRDLLDGMDVDVEDVGERVAGVSLDDDEASKADDGASKKDSAAKVPNLAVTAVDIADWSSVVDRLESTIQSAAVPSSKHHHPAPLLPAKKDSSEGAGFTVDFDRSDVLTLSDDALKGLFNRPDSSTVMVTLMFTLNELFSTSMAKATGFLLRMTDLLAKDTVLLVVDSPGSYSTLTLNKKAEGSETAVQERQYPMKFLLDHTLLSVAGGKWERIYSQDSRWWRREAAKLGYDVGEGAGLEDMRFQVHIYRRL